MQMQLFFMCNNFEREQQKDTLPSSVDHNTLFVILCHVIMQTLLRHLVSCDQVDSYVVTDRAPLPPALVKEHGINYVITFSDVIPSRETASTDDLDPGLGPVAPEEIAARMLGPERIQEYLKDTSISRNYTCRDLNYVSHLSCTAA